MGKSILRLYNNEMKKLLAAMLVALLMVGCSEQVGFLEGVSGMALLFLGPMNWYFFKSSRKSKRIIRHDGINANKYHRSNPKWSDRG